MPFAKPYFTGFEYQSYEIRKFLQTYGMFTLMLTTGTIIHFRPERALDFQRWLNYHCIEDIRLAILRHEALLAK